MKRTGICLIAGLLLAALPLVMNAEKAPFYYGHSRELHASVYHQEENSGIKEGDMYFLSWDENVDAVGYELEIAEEEGAWDEEQPSGKVVYHVPKVYVPGIMISSSALPLKAETKDHLYWRVRPFDLDGKPAGPFSAPRRLEGSLVPIHPYAPLPRPYDEGEKGAALLYPVYSYIAIPGADSYEVEVTSRYPENEDGYAPSRYRVYAGVTTLTDLYDPAPRKGTYYWRVRGLDREGHPVGIWSLPQKRTLDVHGWTVGVFGDSISHGGGHLSFSPADRAYSYESYLSFPVVNLSQSGDTSAMMVERFEKDAVPFHLRTVLIMGGTNSLRAGVPAEEVIHDLETLEMMSYAHGITPVFLTLPPINPASIARAFQEPTAEDWQASFRRVNDFIRTRKHIDTAAPFEGMEVMPPSLALDGLHGDWRAKQDMAAVINEAWRSGRPALGTS